MTLGDLLRQDGAFALLVIGGVIGFFAGVAFRKFVKEKRSSTLDVLAPVNVAAPAMLAPPAPAAPVPAAAAAGSLVVPAPVAGTIIRYSASEGAEVKAGDTILIMESMKMELEIKSAAAGKLRFLVPIGTAVAAQQPIAELSGVAVPVAPAPAMPVPSAPAAAPAPAPAGSVVQPAPVAGTVIRHAVNEGAEVKAGDTILIMESMKMELEIKSTAAGKVHFLVPTGTAAAAQQPIAEIG